VSAFRFSPRPNRAGEIPWSAWTPDAFERARQLDKPILLAISAVWCHWCHVMDETSYSDPEVIAAIGEGFVPIRVDNDERPDVNARYNMGGWPTTAFLTPDGTMITGATYLPPEQMRRALAEVTRFYAGSKDEIAQRAAEQRHGRRTDGSVGDQELRPSMIARVVEEVSDSYDPDYGGFGEAPKFPQPEVLELLLLEHRVNGEARLYEMVAKTLLEMSAGGTYDHVEGGFFRYSTTRDWSVPHFEKMAEDHAGLLRALTGAYAISHHGGLRATLISTLRYVRTVMRDPISGFFAGSQDADEEYYALPLEERKKRIAPFVDRTVYANWNAMLAGAFFVAAHALDDDELAVEGAATLDALYDRMRDGDLLYHVLRDSDGPAVRGLLVDQVAYLRALLDAHETTGEVRFRQRAVACADAIVKHFQAEDGGFYDHAAIEAKLGRLESRDRPIGDNGLLADSLLRLATMTGAGIYREAAGRALRVFARTYGRAGSLAAAYARALRRYLAPEISVTIAGPPAQTAGFREAARNLPDPLVTIVTDPADRNAAAHICVGTTCGSPTDDAAKLRASYDALWVKL
jgi:uncharacterized protein